GEIRLLGGYGNVTINNTTSENVVIEGIDASKAGAGTLLLNDTSFGQNYTTIYQKIGGVVTKIVDPGTGVAPTVTQPAGALSYSPMSGYRYGWSIAQTQYQRTSTTYASATWLSLDELAKDPSNIISTTVEKVGQPVVSGTGPYYYIDTSLESKDYTFSYRADNIGDANTYTTDRHTESTWYGKKTYYTTSVSEQKQQEVDTSTIRADRSININFLGYSEGTVNVTSSAGIVVDGPILNPSGVT